MNPNTPTQNSAALSDRRGLMLVLSSPSGAGKTTLSRMLLESDPEIRLSVSMTTRPPRASEKAGEDYQFVSDSEFSHMVESGGFLEHAVVFGNHYGTPLEPVQKGLSAGGDLLFDIDWQGTLQLQSKMPKDLVTIFILPPSTRELANRLKRRAQDPAEVVAQRMAEAVGEIAHWTDYDYVLINDDVQLCLAQIKSILAAERLKRCRQMTLENFVGRLLDEN